MCRTKNFVLFLYFFYFNPGNRDKKQRGHWWHVKNPKKKYFVEFGKFLGVDVYIGIGEKKKCKVSHVKMSRGFTEKSVLKRNNGEIKCIGYFTFRLCHWLNSHFDFVRRFFYSSLHFVWYRKTTILICTNS